MLDLTGASKSVRGFETIGFVAFGRYHFQIKGSGKIYVLPIMWNVEILKYPQDILDFCENSACI